MTFKKFFYLLTITTILLLNGNSGYSQEKPDKSNSKDESKLIILTGATIIDGVSDKAIKDGTIIIKGDTITDTFYGKTDKIAHFPENALVIDLKGHYIIPGLIDGHVHISHESRAQTEEDLRCALLGGVTSVRDMAGDMRRLASLKRDAKLNEIVSPNIYYSALVSGPSFFNDPRVADVSRGEGVGEVPWARKVTEASNIPQIIAEGKGTGATGIKLYANMEPGLIKRIVEEVHKQGLKAWSHLAVFPSMASDSIDAGMDGVSHSPMFYFQSMENPPQTYLDSKKIKVDSSVLETQSEMYKKLFSRMVEKNIILDATVFVYYYSAEKPTCEEKEKGKWEIMKQNYEFAIKATAAAYMSGVKISAGTDYMVESGDAFPNIHKEIELLVLQCGLTPIDAIRAATYNNAQVMGINAKTGSIEKGKMADLVILTADPLIKIENTRSIQMVIKEGRIFQR